jgi:hypothetical protein
LMAVEEINAGGGIMGRVKSSRLPNECTPTASLDCARGLPSRTREHRMMARMNSPEPFRSPTGRLLPDVDPQRHRRRSV